MSRGSMGTATVAWAEGWWLAAQNRQHAARSAQLAERAGAIVLLRMSVPNSVIVRGPWPLCIGTVSGNAEVACAQGWRPARGNRMSPSSLVVVLMLMNSQLRIRCGTAQPTLTLPQMSHSVGPHQITQFERATVVFAPHAHAFPRTYPRQTRVEHAVTKHVSSHIQSQGAQ